MQSGSRSTSAQSDGGERAVFDTPFRAAGQQQHAGDGVPRTLCGKAVTTRPAEGALWPWENRSGDETLGGASGEFGGRVHGGSKQH